MAPVLKILGVPRLPCNFTGEITKLPWQPFVLLDDKMATNFKKFKNGDVRALKDALEKLNTRKTTSRRILTSILLRHSENSALKPHLSSKLLRAYSSPIDAIKPG